MGKMYECISSFDIDKVDEDGFVTEEFITIECGEVFELVDSNDFSVKLENEEGRWMIIENELFEECFEEVENKNV